MISLSLLDFGEFSPPDSRAHDVINFLFDNILKIEKLGYKRFWLAEHHTNNVSWTQPELLIPLLAGYTESLKLGVAGVLINYHNPLRIARAYKFISSIYPGRIDLGIARGRIPDLFLNAMTDSNSSDQEDQIEANIRYLLNFIKNSFPKDHPYSKIVVQPEGNFVPDIWFLGTSTTKFPYAIECEANVCLSLFHSDIPFQRVKENVKVYKDAFFERNGYLPTIAVATQSACSESEMDLKLIKTEIQDRNWDVKKAICEKPEIFKERILELAHFFNVEEIVLHNTPLSLAHRIRSIELISQSLSSSMK